MLREAIFLSQNSIMSPQHQEGLICMGTTGPALKEEGLLPDTPDGFNISMALEIAS